MARITKEWLDANPDFTCGCGLYVHPSRRNPNAIHIDDCQFRARVEPSAVGRNATIVRTKFETHADMVGKQGLIEKAIKSRNMYRLRLSGNVLWEALPENVRID